jgi:Tfp pilus assembly protein PilN
MDRLNLLPDEARLNPLEYLVYLVDRAFPKAMVGVVAVVAVVGVGITIVQAVKIHRGQKELVTLRESIQTLRVEGQNLESFLKQLERVEQQLQGRKGALDWRLGYLGAVKNQPRLLATILGDLRRNIPSGMWLTDLETTGRSLRISGGATDEDLITQFMGHLKRSSYFNQVNFNYTEKDKIGKRAIVKFEVVCKLG